MSLHQSRCISQWYLGSFSWQSRGPAVSRNLKDVLTRRNSRKPYFGPATWWCPCLQRGCQGTHEPPHCSSARPCWASAPQSWVSSWPPLLLIPLLLMSCCSSSWLHPCHLQPREPLDEGTAFSAMSFVQRLITISSLNLRNLQENISLSFYSTLGFLLQSSSAFSNLIFLGFYCMRCCWRWFCQNLLITEQTLAAVGDTWVSQLTPPASILSLVEKPASQLWLAGPRRNKIYHFVTTYIGTCTWCKLSSSLMTQYEKSKKSYSCIVIVIVRKFVSFFCRPFGVSSLQLLQM